MDKIVPVSPDFLAMTKREFDNIGGPYQNLAGVWENATYLVYMWKPTPLAEKEYKGQMTHIMLSRKDLGIFIPWEHKQAIKNQLCGPETEAVELFPKMSRLTDSQNVYHLWVLQNPSLGFPFGFYDDPEAMKEHKALALLDDVFSSALP